METLNPLLLYGAAAFAVPLIIHLLNRSRYKTIEWGAMHLLESVVVTNSRRVRLEQILLLLIRCAIPIALACCLAMPVLTGWKSLPGDAPASTVILLDNSYSMDAPGQSGSRINEALNDTATIVQSMGKGSDVSVILTGGVPTPLFDAPIFDSEALIDRLAFLEKGRGAAQWPQALELGSTVLSGMTNARRNLIVISDFQSSDMQSLTSGQLDRLKEQTSGNEIPTSITLIRRDGEIGSNLAIEAIEKSAIAIGVGQTLKLRARVRNHGQIEATEVRLRLKVNNTTVDETEIAVAGNATAQALFVHKFQEAGSQVIEVELDAGDDLRTDDSYRVAIDVLENIRVLLVDGDRKSGAMESETDFLSVALTPFRFGRMKLADLLETRVVSPGEIIDQHLQWARVAVVANVERLSDEQVTKLRKFAISGKGLIFFMGDRVNQNWYNEVLHDREGLLPLRLASQEGGPREDDPRSKIVGGFFDHPALQIFNSGGAELSQVDIQQWFRFASASASTESSNSTNSETANAPASDGRPTGTVLMKLDNGDPLIVEKTIGRGFVTAVATSADPDWNTLPLRPVFVPLMQQLVTSIATRGVPETNLSAGQPLVAFMPLESAKRPQVLTLPQDKQKTLKAVAEDGRAVVRYDKTSTPGVYSLLATRTDSNDTEGTATSDRRNFVVETKRTESDLTTLDNDKLQEFAAAIGADVVADGQAFLDLDAGRRHGREIWRWVLVGLLLLLFLELFLQQRFSKIRA